MESGQSVRTIIAGARWCALATILDGGEPFVSYVPLAPVEGGFGTVVSALAAHTKHLSARPAASLLLLGDPAPDDDPFARPRLSIDASAHDVTATARGAGIWSALRTRNGATVEVLQTLPDFRTFWLEPRRGRAVLGFAAARDLDADEIIAACSP